MNHCGKLFFLSLAILFSTGKLLAQQRTTAIALKTGIGTEINFDSAKHQYFLAKVYPGNPGAAAGLRAHDYILFIDDKPISSLIIEDVRRRLHRLCRRRRHRRRQQSARPRRQDHRGTRGGTFEGPRSPDSPRSMRASPRSTRSACTPHTPDPQTRDHSDADCTRPHPGAPKPHLSRHRGRTPRCCSSTLQRGKKGIVPGRATSPSSACTACRAHLVPRLVTEVQDKASEDRACPGPREPPRASGRAPWPQLPCSCASPRGDLPRRSPA